MKKRPEFKADMVVFGIIIFLLGIAFSMFVIEKDPDARLGLFGISIWILVIVGALYLRKKHNRDKDETIDP
ncbi:MAG: hypothetical protein HWE30_11185 [Methylocystaceae bacterium]|nr:hypothetical protein [Methylocystaceae bacterium]